MVKFKGRYVNSVLFSLFLCEFKVSSKQKANKVKCLSFSVRHLSSQCWKSRYPFFYKVMLIVDRGTVVTFVHLLILVLLLVSFLRE